MIKMKSLQPSPAHTAFRDEMVAAMSKHQHLRADEMLAIASYFVGQLVALQDQRKMTAAMAMEIVSGNIELGNEHARQRVASAGGPAS